MHRDTHRLTERHADTHRLTERHTDTHRDTTQKKRQTDLVTLRHEEVKSSTR